MTSTVIKSLRTAVLVVLFLGAAIVDYRSSPIPHDFPLLGYYPERAILEGGNPYDRASYMARYPVAEPFAPYLPHILLLNLPFGLLPEAPAELVYFAFLLALTVLLAYLAMRYNGLRPAVETVFLVATLIIISRPGRLNLTLGNVTLQIVIACYVALYYARRRPWLSGTALALAMSKPSFGVPLGLMMLARRDLRSLVWGAGLVLLLNTPIVALLASRAGGVVAFGKQMAGAWDDYQTLGAFNSPLYSPSRVDGVALVSRLSGHELGALGQVCVALGVFALAAFAVRAANRNYPVANLGLISGIVGGAILLSGYHQPYDVLVLILPMLAVAYGCLPPAWKDRRGFRYGMLALYVIPAVNYLGSFRGLVWLKVLPTAESPVLSREPWIMALVSLNALAVLGIFIGHVVVALQPPETTAEAPIRVIPADRSTLPEAS